VPEAPDDAARLVDALLAREPEDRPTAEDVLGRLGAGIPAIAGAAANVAQSAERGTAVFSVPATAAALEPPRRHATRRRRKSRLVALVAAGIAAAGALAFVGATIANADRVVAVPKVTGMTVLQARGSIADVLHVDSSRAPVTIGSKTYSEFVPAGRVVSQAPMPGSRVERSDLAVVLRVSLGTALAPVPGTEGETKAAALTALRSAGFAASVRTAESWEIPEGRVIASDQKEGEKLRRPGPVGLVVSSGPPKATVPDVRGIVVDDAVARLDGSFETAVVEEGSRSAAAGTVLRQSPGGGTRAVLGSSVTLTVAREPEWGTTWSESGSGAFDSGEIEVKAPKGDWRIVVELRPRYFIFGSGWASLSWEGTGAGHITVGSIGSDEVAPLSGAGAYRLHLDPHGSVNWTVRVEELG
jgi:serine/threonine-protein kinase